jgi:hypothetical protein
MTVYAIGATSLIGGAAGALDAEYADNIANGDPAFVLVQGDKVYHYIANSTSAAAESSPDVIAPDEASAGVAYTGDLRWIRHAVYGVVDVSGTPVDNDFAKFTDADTIEGRSYAEVRTDLNVEDGADVTDTTNVTAAGALMDSEVDADLKTFVLPANTTISAYGKTLVDDAAAVNARSTLGVVIGTDVLAEQTIGIADNNLLEVDGSPNDDEYAKFTANGLEGRTESEFKGDFNLEIGTDVLAQQTIGIADDNLLEVDGSPSDDEYAKFTANGLEGRTYANVRTDINVEDGADVTDATNVASAGAVMGTDFAAKGDILSASADDTPVILSVGSNTQVLAANSAQASGLEWVSATAPAAHKDTHDPEDGSDPLDAAAAAEIAGVQAAAEGSSHSFARADHVHQIQAAITDNHILTVDDASAADDEYARFTANGLEGVAGASDAEAKTGTDTDKPVTPANLRAAVSGATTVTTTYTSLITDSVIYGNHATTAFTITLLAAATAGANKRYTIANINAALVTVDGNGSETVGGLPKQCIGQNEAITIDCDGSNWHIVHDARVKSSVNELTNSGFGVWSNSEDLYTTAGTVPCTANVCVGRGLAPNNSCTTPSADTEADATTGWTNGNWDTFESSTTAPVAEPDGSYSLHLVAGDNYDNATMASAMTTEVGKLYELNVVYINADGVAGSEFEIRTGTSQVGSQYGVSDALISATWATYSFVFEATGTEAWVYFQEAGSNNDCEVWINQVSLHEVTPGIVSATNAGPDGWVKSVGADVYREHSGTYTKEGSFYALKSTTAANTFHKSITELTELESIAGRTMTMGAWVWCDTASAVRVRLGDSAADSFSSYHSGGSSYEWLEVTRTITASPTNASIGFYNESAGAIVYFSQPMLVFGSSLGEGNYVAPVGEIVWCDTAITPTNYYNAEISADATIPVEAETNGKIPKGFLNLWSRLNGTPSATDKYMRIPTAGLRLSSVVASKNIATSGWAKPDSDGNLALSRDDTWSSAGLIFYAVQVS